MNKREPKKRLIGPWRAVHAAIWLIGIAILAIFDWWWPGILVLLAISGLVEAYLRRNVPQSYEVVPDEVAETQEVAQARPAPPVAAPPATSTVSSVQAHRLELLPRVCPNCNGPIRGHEVKWTGQQSADCPYCGSNLPMAKA